MLRKFLPAILVALSACQTINASPLDRAKGFIGLTETKDRQEIKQLVGVDPVRTEWCAAFVNAMLNNAGIPGSESVSEYPLMARSFLDWGEEVHYTKIQYGDIVVFPRGNEGWKGHVGFYVGTYPPSGEWIILGGNQNNQVKYSLYYPGRAISIRRHIE